MQKRKLDNMTRIAEGKAPLPEDDLAGHSAFQEPEPPSRLESLLVTGQISHYCKQISQFAASNFGKLFLAEGLQGTL